MNLMRHFKENYLQSLMTVMYNSQIYNYLYVFKKASPNLLTAR